MSLTTIPSRLPEDSGAGESDDSDIECVKDERQTARNERRHTISLFGKKSRNMKT